MFFEEEKLSPVENLSRGVRRISIEKVQSNLRVSQLLSVQAHLQRPGINRSFPEKSGLFLVRDYAIKPYIPRIWGNFLDFLALKRDAEQLWTNPVLAMFQKRKAAVIVSAAHTNSTPVFVEGDGRCNDEFEFSGSYQEAACRLPYTEAILLKVRIRVNFAKDHFGAIAQNRDENALVCAPGPLDDFTCIHFVTHRQVATDQGTCVVIARSDYTFADDRRSSNALING